MTPVTFDGCFGWLHLPEPGRPTSCRGVVQCGPHGLEELCVHRVWRGLAIDLAAAGLACLRFDYPGSGDSAGDDTDPERLRSWLDAVVAAVRFLRRHGGVTEVALVGLRLGGALAAMAAREAGGIDRLALIAPVVSGRSYLRELKVLSLLSSNSADAAAPPADPGEFAGYAVTETTQGELRRIDLAKLETAPAKHVLLLHRPEQVTEIALTAAWGRLGAEVQAEPLVGYGELMRDTTFAVRPEAAFARLVAWLGDGANGGAATPEAAPPARIEVETAHETPIEIGTVGMVGILCRPRKAPTPGPVVLLLNTGANHRVGAARMSVTVARRLAAQGVTSLRLDLSGLGDSPTRPGLRDNLLYDEAATRDAREAIDWLEDHGFARVMMVGLCGGAFVAFHAGAADPRVDGLVMINLPRFTAPEEPLERVVRSSYRGSRHYARLFWQSSTWARALRGRVDIVGIAREQATRLARRMATRLRGATAGLSGRRDDQPTVMAGFRTLVARGGRALLVYSADEGGLDELEVHTGRDARHLLALPGMRLEILDGADHTLTGSPARERLTQLIEEQLGLRSEAAVDAKRAATVSP